MLNQLLDTAWLRQALAHADGPEVLPAAGLEFGELKPAAVLVGLIGGPAPGVLLTKRASGLRSHSGQVSFPGGRIDPGDASVEAAALREAHEEVGLAPSLVELAGRLPDHVVLSGYRMTPVVGVVGEGFEPRLSAAEVERVFVLPFEVLLDPAAPERREASLQGRAAHYWVWPHAEHYIWGATAAILVGLAARLRAGLAAG